MVEFFFIIVQSFGIKPAVVEIEITAFAALEITAFSVIQKVNQNYRK